MEELKARKIAFEIFWPLLINFISFPVNHLGEKSHKCAECGLAFSLANKLNVHRRLVHEGRKFSCDLCGMEYNSTKSVKRHCLKAHGVEHKRKKWAEKPKTSPISPISEHPIGN